MTTRYTFKYLVEGNVNVIDEWLRRQPPAVRAKFLSDFKYMADAPKGEWPPKKTFVLTGEFSELREFRVQKGPVHYRLGGFEGPNEGEITLCSGWTRSQDNAEQKRAKRRALQLKALVEQGKVATVDHI